VTHQSLTVALPADVTDPSDALVAALSPFEHQWNWWQIGGRWRGRFRIREGAVFEDLIDGGPGVTNESVPMDPAMCDGGRVRALDIEGVRHQRSILAAHEHDEYMSIVSGTPQHRPWSEFLAKARAAHRPPPDGFHPQAVARALERVGFRSVDELQALHPEDQASLTFVAEVDAAYAEYRAGLDYDYGRASADYAAQPRIVALRAASAYQDDPIFWPEEEFDRFTRDEYVQYARDRAIPGFAFLTHDGRWSTERDAGYLDAANRYVDQLPLDAWLVNVDIHS
jgi:hypothetical protein